MQQITFSVSKQEDALLLILLCKRLGAVLVEQKIIEQTAEIEQNEFVENLENSLSFEQWNEQFEGEEDLSENVPDLDMTLGDFRKKIWEAETDDKFITLAEFTDELKTWN